MEAFMKIREFIFRFMLICLLIMPCNWARGDESPDLRLVQTGKGVYSLQGSGYKGVAGTDVTIRYDAALLGNPVIEFGELATGSTTSNTSQAGQIRIISVDINGNANSSGTGTFATVTFDIIGKPAGSISAHVNLVDIDG